MNIFSYYILLLGDVPPTLEYEKCYAEYEDKLDMDLNDDTFLHFCP